MSAITYPLTLETKGTGELFEFTHSARTTADGRFRFVWTLAPGKTGPGHHTHPTETETFRVVSGTLRLWIDGTPHELTAGMTRVVPPATPHRFLNPGREPVVVEVDLDGTLMEDMLVGAAVRAQSVSTGRAVMGMIVTLAATKSSVPVSGFQRGMLGAFARVLRLFGVRKNPVPERWMASDDRSAVPRPS